MTDRLGGLPLPAPVPVPPAPSPGPRAATSSAGDPALAVLGGFLATVLAADLATAWAALAPGRPVVRRIFPFSVFKRRFIKEDLPSLFLYRSGPGQTEPFTADYYRRTQTVLVQWVFPPALNENQIERDPFANALCGAVERAIYRGRHPAWVVPADRGTPEGLVLPIATSLGAVTLTGALLTGLLAGQAVHAPRSVVVTTAPQMGAYTVNAPITIAGFDGRRVLTDTVRLTAPNGGEAVPSLRRFAQVTRIELPPMPSSNGRITIGYADSPEVALGSLVQRHAGLLRLDITKPGDVKPLLIHVKNPQTRAEDTPLPFEMLEIPLTMEELLEEDPALHYAPLPAQQGGRGASVDYLADDGTSVDAAELE